MTNQLQEQKRELEALRAEYEATRARVRDAWMHEWVDLMVETSVTLFPQIRMAA